MILGALTAIGPLAIDMYLPALPDHRAASSAPMPQRCRSASPPTSPAWPFGQAFYGPLSDAVGRKPALLFGLAVFILSSVACASAGSVDALVAFRFLQALGGCAPIVIPRAVVRDYFDRVGSIRMLSMLMLVMGLAPILPRSSAGNC